MKVLTAAEMREVDRHTVELGIPGIVLMENAGHRVVEFLEKRFDGKTRSFASLLFLLQRALSTLRITLSPVPRDEALRRKMRLKWRRIESYAWIF